MKGCVLQRKGRLGKKKEGRVSIVSRAGSGFLLFSRRLSVGYMGVAATQVKRTMASHFIGLLTDPKLPCPIVMKSGSPKNIRVCGAHFH